MKEILEIREIKGIREIEEIWGIDKEQQLPNYMIAILRQLSGGIT